VFYGSDQEWYTEPRIVDSALATLPQSPYLENQVH